MQRGVWPRYLVFCLLAVGGCAADLWTKHQMFGWPALERGQVYWLWNGYVGFQISLNEGALFGMGQGMVVLFVAVSALAAIAIPVWLVRLGGVQRWSTTLALGAILGGILGNLYDRLGLPGLVWHYPLERVGQPVYAVRDWMLLQWSNELRWPNFNIADALLVVGAGLIVMQTFWQDQHPERQSGASENDPSETI